MTKYIAAVATAACIASGCSHVAESRTEPTAYSADGSVSSEIVDRPSTERYELRSGQTYLRALPRRENTQPAYPENLLAERLDAVTVVARLVVNKEGAVENAIIVPPVPEQPEFSEAVLSAVRTWHFIPLKRIVGSSVELLPFTQDYRFTFKQVNGRAAVVAGSTREG